MADTKNCEYTLKSFEKNRYFYGKLMTVRDFKLQNDYHAGQLQLVNKFVHGVGIVCGLKVTKDNTGEIKFKINNTEFSLTTGVALDCCGREIVVPPGIAEITAEIEEGTAVNEKRQYYVYLKYAEKDFEKVSVGGSSSCGEESCCDNRSRETFSIEVSKNATCSIWDKDLQLSDLQATGQQCSDNCNDSKVLLAVLDYDETLTINTAETQKRNLVFSNPTLFRLINAKQTGALKTINGVTGDPNNQNITLKPGSGITISHSGDNEITISATSTGTGSTTPVNNAPCFSFDNVINCLESCANSIQKKNTDIYSSPKNYEEVIIRKIKEFRDAGIYTKGSIQTLFSWLADVVLDQLCNKDSLYVTINNDNNDNNENDVHEDLVSLFKSFEALRNRDIYESIKILEKICFYAGFIVYAFNKEITLNSDGKTIERDILEKLHNEKLTQKYTYYSGFKTVADCRLAKIIYDAYATNSTPFHDIITYENLIKMPLIEALKLEAKDIKDILDNLVSNKIINVLDINKDKINPTTTVDELTKKLAIFYSVTPQEINKQLAFDIHIVGRNNISYWLKNLQISPNDIIYRFNLPAHA